MNIINCIGLTAAAVVWMGAKPVGYLARLGPAPLRFQAPAKGPEVTVALPPLAMSDPAPGPIENLNPQPTTNETATVVTPASSSPAPEPVVSQPQPVIVAEPAFTPQMLVPFFNRSGTNQDFSLIVPYQFTPPPPAPNIPAPPSKATYTTK